MTVNGTHRVFSAKVSTVYPLYVAKVSRKGRTQDELDTVVCWLTGFTRAELHHHIDGGATFEELFAHARLPDTASLITGVVCGVRVEEVEHPLMRKIRMLDKLVDELARGKALTKIVRST